MTQDVRVSGSTAYQFSLGRFGRPTTLYERGQQTVYGWGQVLQSNPMRLAWLIVNRGEGEVYLRMSPGVDYYNSLPLGPLGGSASMCVEEDGETVTRPVYIWTTRSGMWLYIMEVVAL